MLKLATLFCVTQVCLSYYVPLSIEFMGNKAHVLNYNLGRKADLEQCQPYVTAWNTWPGGVTGTILVHSESDPAIDTWAVNLEFDRNVGFKTYDGTPDKTEGKKFTVTPVSWNGVTQAGTVRVVNFQLTHSDLDHEVKLVSIAISGKDEVRCSNEAPSVEVSNDVETATNAATDANADVDVSGDRIDQEVVEKDNQAQANNDRGVFVKWPKKIMGIYILLADDDHKGFESNAEWEPRLYEYQQKGANVLFFTFIHPQTMEVPPSYQKLAKTRGTNVEGAVPADTVIIFAIGGYAYSVKQNPWNWLTSKEAAEAMAERVAEWPEKYGCDGIDLDLEDGAGNRKEAGPNLVHFIRRLRQLVPNMIISQPTYGYPQIEAENDVINESWDKQGNSNNLADSVGLMVYEGSQSLSYVKNFVNGADQWEGFPIKVRTPKNTILLGAKGASSPAVFEELSNAALKEDYLGIMVWYASVKNGLQYGASWDASEDKAAQEAYINVVNKFKAAA